MIFTATLLGFAASALHAPQVKPPPRLAAILFDIDGTLFNSDSLHLLAFQDSLEEEGFNGGQRIDEYFFLERISGRQNLQIVKDLFPEKSAAEGAAFSDRKEAKFRELAASKLPSLVTPGLAQLLKRLRDHGVRCAAVTNAPRANAELMLGAIGRLDCFEPLIIGDECTAGKPDPEPYLRAMRELGVTADECIAFEDSPAGARAAVAAGVTTIGITSTQPAAALVDASGCSFAISDFTADALWQELDGKLPGISGLPPTRPMLWLLDRDGCINEDVGAPGVVSIGDLRLIPGSAGAVRRLRLAGPVCIVTNQSCRGLGLLSADALDEIHERLRHLLATTARGGRTGRSQWDSLYVCETAGAAPADERKKPNPGMILEACRDFEREPSDAIMVGDSWGDVVAAQRAGSIGVLVTTGHGASLGAALCDYDLPVTVTAEWFTGASERAEAAALASWFSSQRGTEAALIQEALSSCADGVRVYRDLAQAVDELTQLPQAAEPTFAGGALQ